MVKEKLRRKVMKYIAAGGPDVKASAVIQGCMRIDALTQNELDALIKNDLELGINFFDHADIYGDGICEEKFGQILKMEPSLRDKIILQSKCGIAKGEKNNYFDFSKEYIIGAAEASLKRLETDHLDYLLLHRPDALMEPEEVAEAFDQLEKQGKVLKFGVSNQNPMQIELLKTCVKQPLRINQMQFSVAHSCMVSEGMQVNTMFDGGICRDGSILNYARIHKITIQCWSPFQYGAIEGTFMGNPDYPEVNEALQVIGKKYGITDSAAAVAWILRHPADMQVIAGTCNQKRMRDIVKACDVKLSREDWYWVYKMAGNAIP